MLKILHHMAEAKDEICFNIYLDRQGLVGPADVFFTVSI